MDIKRVLKNDKWHTLNITFKKKQTNKQEGSFLITQQRLILQVFLILA